ncbi:VOC family protein [Spongiibacter sp. KMU-166]|uniref:VOC family protein n=1 Tax=Spongiibacter thalassae TaxID=2721624 RepID=A0ABX1GCA5_9GAMM|nr:VOC family protein [Spongiibacter thalassae]NKI15894.1 VOC family protein [Spongiibacter thalassae]
MSMLQPNGIHHLAICTSDMRKTLLYFNDVLGFPLAALYWMHGVKNTVHGFLKINDSSCLAFVYSPKIIDEKIVGITHPATISDTSTRGTMHHLAFNVDSQEALTQIRERILAKGIACSEINTQGYPVSFTFPGPEGMLLQIGCQPSAEENVFDEDAAAAIGLDKAAMEALKSHKPYNRPASPVPNALLGADAGYHMNYPDPVYRTLISAPDELVFDFTQDNVPPNEKQPFNVKRRLAKLKLLFRIILSSISRSRGKA